MEKRLSQARQPLSIASILNDDARLVVQLHQRVRTEVLLQYVL